MKTIEGLAVLFTLLYFVHEFGQTVGKGLDDYILNFEHVDYSATDLHERHMRHRRSPDTPVHVNINAYNRKFKLVLKHDRGGFAKAHTLEFQGSDHKPDLSFLYSGHVDGVPGSQVHGAIIQGIFRGRFSLPSEQETYHVEKSRKFFDDPVYHSVIFKESEMDLDPYRERREREKREAKEPGTCAYESNKHWMRETIASEYITPNRAKRSAMNWQEVRGDDEQNKYTAYANKDTKGQEHARKKRATLGARNSCFMSLTSDIKFWNHYLEKAADNADVAKDEILAFFSSHIIAINQIYGRTVFKTMDDSISYSGVQFRVQKTKIMTNTDCSSTNPLRHFCEDNIDVSNFLNMNSLLNHNDFCLAYIFTFRDFNQGTLGLAWVGAASRAAGGLCETFKKYQESGKNVFKSLNTGIITTINYGKPVPAKVSQLTFAHEVGHNFGSPHDSGTECAPYGTSRGDANEGNYIMFASATMGDRVHNSQFSKCSLDNITRVLDTVIREEFGKVNCFKEGEASFCGNGLVEDGEECDCGFENDCEDICCNAKQTDNTGNTDQECKLKAGKVCSPSQGPCCDEDTCNYTSLSTNKTCRYKEDCFGAAYCNGTTALCPNSQLVSDGEFCNDYGFTCKQGECAGSLCENFGWVECFYTSEGKSNKNSRAEQEQLCKLGCRPNDTSECILSNSADEILKYNGYNNMITEVLNGRAVTDKSSGVQLAPGSPCDNFQGYCDVFYRCRSVDAEGPLARLKNLIFSPETLQDITNWIVEHWWAVLLMAIGLVLAMGLFIKFCAVHTPSSNPKAKPARKLSETMTLRRRRNQNRQNPSSQTQAPQQVRYPQSKERGYRERERERDYPYMNPQGPPPPYPGSSSHSAHHGPPHGHGKGKGRHKSKDMEMGRI